MALTIGGAKIMSNVRSASRRQQARRKAPRSAPKRGNKSSRHHYTPSLERPVLAKGIKLDGRKVPLQLLSPLWLMGVGTVLAFGAEKYAAHNWRNGIEHSRLIGAALRHLLAYLDGEDLDPETGLPHLHHLSCCVMFLSELSVTHPHLDDRYRRSQKQIKNCDKDRRRKK